MRKSLVPLHVKGDRSFGRGVGSPTEYAARAAILGLPALALTDAESLGAQVEFHVACRQYDVKPITGTEIAVPSADAPDGRIVALVQNRSGYTSLCRLMTELTDPTRERKSVNSSARHPASPYRNELIQRLVHDADGLYFLTADPFLLLELHRAGVRRSEIGAALVRPATSAAREAALVVAAKSLDVEIVADLDVVMPSEGDAELYGLLQSIHGLETTAWSSTRPKPGSLTPAPEQLFSDARHAVDAACRVAERCSFDLLSLRVPTPRSDVDDANRALRERCRRAGVEDPSYASRLSAELSTIAKLGLSDYFVMVAELADEARRRGISLLARGSAVGSLVVHRLGLSPVDPVASGLYFERFVSSMRSVPPDVDLDVSSARRDELARWAVRRWGRACASEVVAYQTFQRRGAFRDGLRALGMSASAVERFAETLPNDDLPLAVPVQSLPLPYRARVPLLERLIGRPRHLSTHPSGLVVSGVPLSDWVPLSRAPKGSLVTQFDASSLERLFALKIDLLGSRAISSLEEVSRRTGAPCLGAPTDDCATLECIDRGSTVGCAQLESPLVRSVLEALPIRSLADVTVALALVRPGAASGGARERFIRRARGEEPAPSDGSWLDAKLASTHGICVFEEDLIGIISSATNVAPDEADAMRAAIARGEDVSRSFFERAAAAGFARAEARVVFENLNRFAAYSFSKAHASSAAWIGYQAAFAKTHFPSAFASGLLNFSGGLYPLRALAAEMHRSGVSILAPDVNVSERSCVVEGQAVRIGLDRMKRVTRATKERLLEARARDGPFRSVSDLVERVRPSRPELVAFVLTGACDALPPLNRDEYPFLHQAVLAAVGASADVPRRPASSERVGVYRALVRARNELRYLDMHPSAHPMEILRPEAARAGCASTEEARRRPNERIRFAGIVTAMRRAAAATGVVQFVTFEDEHGLLEGSVAPDVYTRLADPIRNPGPYLVEGKLELRHGSPVLNVQVVYPFHRRARPYSDKSEAPGR